MGQFPSLNQEDLVHFDTVLNELLGKSEANIALIVEKAGYLIHQCGSQKAVDTTTFATLGSNAYNAVHFMAQLVNEHNFASMYQQGQAYSTLILNVDQNCILVVIFGTQQTVGSMKYYAVPVVKQIGEQLKVAAGRGETPLDLSDMDATDVQSLFRRV